MEFDSDKKILKICLILNIKFTKRWILYHVSITAPQLLHQKVYNVSHFSLKNLDRVGF